MAEMRAKFPDKFNPKKNNATANFKAKAARGELGKPKTPGKPKTAYQLLKERALAAEAQLKISGEKAGEITVQGKLPVGVAPAPEKIISAATTAQILPSSPAPVITPAPVPPVEPQIAVESDLFSTPPPADKLIDETNAPPPAPDAQTAGQGTEQPKAATNSPGINRALATMVWGMILQFCVLIFGNGMLPQVFKTPAGDIDENENVINAWCEYFDSLGMKKLSPLWNLILTVAAYFLIRLNHIVIWFKSRKLRSAKPTSQAPEKPETTEEPEPKPREETERPEPARTTPPRTRPEATQTETEETNFAQD